MKFKWKVRIAYKFIEVLPIWYLGDHIGGKHNNYYCKPLGDVSIKNQYSANKPKNVKCLKKFLFKKLSCLFRFYHYDI